MNRGVAHSADRNAGLANRVSCATSWALVVTAVPGVAQVNAPVNPEYTVMTSCTVRPPVCSNRAPEL